MKISDSVYSYIWTNAFENNCNMYYFGDPVNILFDPGLKNHLDARIEDMKKDGLDPEIIKYIVNTHSHPDHFEGSLYFMEKETQIAMHQEEIDFVNKVGPTFFEMMGMDFPKIKFDKVLEEGTWKIGNSELEIYKTPGHSPGSVSIYWPEKKTLVCGDLLFQKSVGRVDFPGGDGELLKKSISKISELDIEILLPGHMDIIIGKDEVIKNFEFIEQYITMMI